MIEVVCAVIMREGRVLIAQRATGHLAGLWEFPGGKVDAGESAEEALEREIREELGCGVMVGEAMSPVEHDYPELSIRLRPFWCAVGEGEPVALEHAAIRWVERGRLMEEELAPADVKVAGVVAD